jgi:glycosyltransferase involved in cell wall biosynthesis
MKILQLSTTDLSGGAEGVAWQLFQEYRRLGHDSWLAVGRKQHSDPGVLLLNHEKPNNPWSRLWRGIAGELEPYAGQVKGAGRGRLISMYLAEPIRWLGWELGREDFDFPATRHLLERPPQRPDILHCHNLHGPTTSPRGDYFDLRMLPWLSRQVPVVMTLHDAWLLSGHCAHSLDCERWKIGCGRCPYLTIYPAMKRDATAYNWRRKKSIFEQSRLYVSSPSGWLMNKVENSILAPAIADKRVIPNGVDLSVFRPGDKEAARRELGLPQDANILMFAAHSIRDNCWKDFDTVEKALALMARRPEARQLLLLAVGDGAGTQAVGTAEIRFFPYKRDPQLMAKFYQAADIYLHSAKADTFPTTVLEAFACGKPVVATAVGGIPEQVDVGNTGFLVPPADPQAVAECTMRLTRDPALQTKMAAQAVAAAQSRFSLDRAISDYLEWYEFIIEDFHRRGRVGAADAQHHEATV